MSSNKFLGSVMILIGTTIGAGMLALPLVGAASGFMLSTLLMIFICILATMTGLFVVEVNLALPAHACSFSSMAEQTLGNFGKIVTWITYLFLLYMAIYAYTSGESSVMSELLKSSFDIELKSWITPVIFVSVLGVAVFSSTKTVDYFNRGLISVKGLLLISTIAVSLPHIDFVKLLSSTEIDHLSRSKYLWSAAPVFLCSFCAQFVIPSLRLYVGPNVKQLKLIVIYGASATLVLNVLWAAATFGNIPLFGKINSFASIGTNAGEFTRVLSVVINSKLAASAINGFSNIVMTTSFLGVSLALFDFLADGFKIPNTKLGRLRTTIMTFTPPLVFAILFPKGFVAAMNYATISVAILLIILPALMVYSLRKNPSLTSPYRAKCNNFGIWLIVAIGAAFIILPILINLGIMPTF